jgi:hypothetical protein
MISSEPVFEECKITNNMASNGGGFFINDLWVGPQQTVRILKCEISNNSAVEEPLEGRGGGLYCGDYSAASIFKSTICGNTAESIGGGIYSESWMANDIDVLNSIGWFNTPDQINGNTLVSYSLFYADPLLINPDQSDYRLLWGSPCIDTGDPNPLYNDPDGTVADKGAYYYDQSMPLRVTATPYNTPIEIPPEGGSFDYEINLTWIDPVSQPVNVFTAVWLPTGVEIFPLLGPVTVTLDSGITLTWLKTQTVPPGAPAGLYVYQAWAAVSTDSCRDAFTFTKLGGGVSDALSGWSVTGESFEEWLVESPETVIPTAFALHPNYPNPLNPQTTLRFDLPQAARVQLAVFNVRGQKVKTLINGWREAGYHEIIFNGFDFASGVYVIHLSANRFVAAQKVILMK